MTTTAPQGANVACDACEVAAERFASDGHARTCVCGRVHGPDDFRWPVAPTRADTLVRVPFVAPPGGSRLLLGSLREEDAELVRVRRLLCELRPDPAGPLGWGPYDEAPPPPPEVTDEGRSIPGPLASRVRVQTSPDPSPIPKDAFGGRAPLSGGRRVAERIHGLSDREAAATLNWLQRFGTLARGLGALYTAAGQALATPEQRERWKASTAAGLDGPRVVGRRRVNEAARVWWGETAPEVGAAKEGA